MTFDFLKSIIGVLSPSITTISFGFSHFKISQIIYVPFLPNIIKLKKNETEIGCLWVREMP